MKTIRSLIATVAIFSAALCNPIPVHAASDLCGGTGGNGQIVQIGIDSFTLKRNGDGREQTIRLSGAATINTSVGKEPLSYLKPGDRVTLVGGPNPDGSFTADAVFLCAGAIEGASGPGTSSAAVQRNADFARIDAAIRIATAFVLVSLWFAVAAFLRLTRKKSFVYLLLFTVFYIYLYKVVDYTLLQFQSLLFLKHFVPDLMLRGQQAGDSINIVPLLGLTGDDVKTSLLNILLLMPFGFGLPFITNLRMEKVVVAGMSFSIAIECLQLATGFIGGLTFRVADINDVLFNTIGAAVGYVIFVGFIRIYRRIVPAARIGNPILRYIADRPQIRD